MTRCLATVFLLSALSFAAAAQAAPVDTYAPGTRSGPFVVTDRSLGDLLKEGYEIRGNLGSALVLQKAASVFSCVIPPDPEHLSYRPYFVCSELKEEPRGGGGKPAGTGITPGAKAH